MLSRMPGSAVKYILSLLAVLGMLYLTSCTHSDNGQSHKPWVETHDWEYNQLGGAR